MIRKNQVGAIADVQASRNADVGFFEHFDFGDERRGVDNHAGADDDVLLGPQDPTGDELENVAVLADDDRVPGIVASGDARDVIKRSRQIIDNLALAFISPLRANHNDRFHSEILLDRLAGTREPHFLARRDTRLLCAKSG